MTDFAGRIVVVTGGANGMGEATARLFARSGASVIIIDKDADRAPVIEAEIRDQGGEAVALVADIRERREVDEAFDEILGRFHRIDVLDNNAAGALELAGGDGDILDLDPCLLMETMRGNVLPILLACRRALPAMLEQGSGSIINIASVSGMLGELSLTAYGASKAAVIQLTRAMATQHGRAGVRINAVAPAYVTTSNNALYAPAGLQGIYEHAMQAPQVPAPEDVAQLVRFLASDEASLINGHTVPIDGGLTAASPIVSIARHGAPVSMGATEPAS